MPYLIPTAENSKREKTTANTLISSRCCANTAMDFFYNKVLHLLNDEHRKFLLGTLFFHLFGFPRGTVTSYAFLQQILLLWDNDEERNASNSTATHLSSPPKRYHSWCAYHLMDDRWITQDNTWMILSLDSVISHRRHSLRVKLWRKQYYVRLMKDVKLQMLSPC